MEGLMEGTMEEGSEAFLQELGDAPGDVRCMFLRHLLSAASERMRMHGERCRLWERKKEVLGQFASYRKREQPEKPEDFLKQRAHALLVREQNGLLKPWEERLERMVDEWLKELLLGPGRMEFLALFSEDGAGIEELLQTAGLLEAKREIEAGKEALLRDLNRVTGCLHRAFGEDAELADWLCGIRNHGDYRYCGFSRPEYAGLLEERRQEERLRKTIHEMEGFYETADFV